MTFKKSDISFTVGVLSQTLNWTLVEALVASNVGVVAWLIIGTVCVLLTIGGMTLAEKLSNKFGVCL